ncbi:MAG: DUF2997 domain-containing protein [bacterium]
MKIIEVIVDTKGGVSMETKGFAVTGCRDVTKALERALGVITSDRDTPELHLASEQSQQQSLGSSG